MADQLPVILLHGFPLCGEMFAAQGEALRRAGYEVRTPDFPGFGDREPWPIEDCSMESFAGDVAELISCLPSKRAIVGGFSMGGYVLLSLLRMAPELVAGVILLDTQAAADSVTVRAARAAAIADVQNRGLAPLADAMCERLLSAKSGAEIRLRVRQIIQRQSVAGVVAAQSAMMRRASHEDMLARLTQPSLIIVGKDDVITPPTVASAMAALLARAAVVEVANAGHLACMERPDEVNAAILDWLRVIFPQ